MTSADTGVMIPQVQVSLSELNIMIHLPTLEGFGGVEVVGKFRTTRVFSKCVLRADAC